MKAAPFRQQPPPAWDNRSAPGGAVNTVRGLTHSLDQSKEQAVNNATRDQEPLSDEEAPDWVLNRSEASSEGCWTWTGTYVRRYGGNGGDRASYSRRSAARVLWEELRGPLPKTQVVRHTCHNQACVRPSHLVTGTHKQNSQDAVRAGRLRPGGGSLTDYQRLLLIRSITGHVSSATTARQVDEALAAVRATLTGHDPVAGDG